MKIFNKIFLTLLLCLLVSGITIAQEKDLDPNEDKAFETSFIKAIATANGVIDSIAIIRSVSKENAKILYGHMDQLYHIQKTGLKYRASLYSKILNTHGSRLKGKIESLYLSSYYYYVRYFYKTYDANEKLSKDLSEITGIKITTVNESKFLKLFIWLIIIPLIIGYFVNVINDYKRYNPFPVLIIFIFFQALYLCVTYVEPVLTSTN
jgi:hypothetical protein